MLKEIQSCVWPWSFQKCFMTMDINLLITDTYRYESLYSHSRGSSLSLKLLVLLMWPLLLVHPFTMWVEWILFVLVPHIVSSSSGPNSGVCPITCTTELDPRLKLVSVWSGCNRFSHRELSHGSEKTVCVSSLSLICEAQ